MTTNERDVDERVREMMSRLTTAGGRRTASRQAILESIASAGSHPTAEEIARLVQSRFPSINLSTVYRTLDALAEQGVIQHVHFGHGPAVFHLAQDAHHHLYCEKCGSVEEIEPAKLRPLLRMLERVYGFSVDHRHFAIAGRCRGCRQS